MKRIILISILLLKIFAIAAQSSLFTDVQTGTKEFYRIIMKNGTEYNARIISVDPEKVLLLLSDGESLSVPTNGVVEVKKKSFSSSGSAGIGIGIPYGAIGANVDIKLYQSLYATAGIGTGININPLYSAGLKFYLLSGGYKFRPRLSVNYGSAKIIITEDLEVKEIYHKLYFAAGFQWALGIRKSIGLDIDLIYIPNDNEFEERVKNLENNGYTFDLANTSDIDFSIGLRYLF